MSAFHAWVERRGATGSGKSGPPLGGHEENGTDQPTEFAGRKGGVVEKMTGKGSKMRRGRRTGTDVLLIIKKVAKRRSSAAATAWSGLRDVEKKIVSLFSQTEKDYCERALREEKKGKIYSVVELSKEMKIIRE